MGFSMQSNGGDFQSSFGYSVPMNLAQIRSAIVDSSPELRAGGINALYLFGSQARGDAGEASDIDLLFEVSDDSRFNLIDQAHFQIRLQEILGRKVDFISRDGMRPRMKRRVEAEMVRLL
ncbi:MAG: nucleotidyltransferase domain-containing protein [Novosphingobium sp.]